MMCIVSFPKELLYPVVFLMCCTGDITGAPFCIGIDGRVVSQVEQKMEGAWIAISCFNHYY